MSVQWNTDAQHEAERSSAFYAANKPVDSFFICPHGVDKCETRCEQCEAEVQELLSRADIDEYMTRKEQQKVDEHRDGLR